MSWFEFSALEWITIASTLIYNFLLVKQRIACWPFGILSSVTGSVLFVQNSLWGQFILYVFYALMGIYGWWFWYNGSRQNRPVIRWSLQQQVLVFTAGLIISFVFILLYKHFSPGSAQIIPDVLLTVFSFIATFKEAQKVMTGWIYWIVLNALSFWLYANSGLHGLASLSAVYSVLSVTGFISWRRSYREQQANGSSPRS